MTARGNQAATVQVAVSTATAAKFGLHIGTRLSTFGQILVVTGIVRPRDPASSFWTVAPVVAAPELIQTSTAGAPYWSGAAFVGTAGLAGLQDYLGTDALRATWAFPLSLGSVNADQAAGLLANVQALSFLPAAAAVSTNLSTSSGSQSFNGTQGASSPLTVTLADGLVTVLPSFVATDDAVQRALSLLFISLAVIAAVVVLLGARLVAEHRHTELAMMRARGASLRQIARVALAGGAAAALPAAVIAVAAAVLVTPGPASLLSWWLVALIVVTALAGPPLLAVWAHRTRPDAGAGAGKPAITRRRVAAARRWVFDAALVAAAVGGLVLLRQQGLPPPGSVDLFTSAAPVLVAVPG
jgi:putative ABC transport system permease protein